MLPVFTLRMCLLKEGAASNCHGAFVQLLIRRRRQPSGEECIANPRSRGMYLE